MKTSSHNPIRSGTTLTVLLVAACTLAGCASAPKSPEGAADARARLTQLQGDPNLANLAPVALEEADEAVRLAEQPVGRDIPLGAHRVYMADRKVDIAVARATTRYAEDQRAKLAEERGQSRLDARTLEADRARDDADDARSEAAEAAELAALEAAELRRQIEMLKAEETERGLVLTLGDLLFAFDSAELKSGATSTLDRLVAFLNQYPTRKVAIEGHTDSVGNPDYNYRLSQRRAESVKSYLVQAGISFDRLSASGKGQDQPLASNDSESGRQQNRRVELIIDKPQVASAAGVSH